MLYRLEARDVGFDEENDTLTVGFGGVPDADGSPRVYLTLQRSTDEDEDEPGIDGVYAEWCGQGMSCDGCIRSFDLYRQSIRVTFTEDADFYVLEGVEEVSEGRRLTELLVTFSLDDAKFAELKGKLSFIFKDFAYYAVHEVDAATSA